MQGSPLVAKVLSYLSEEEAKNLHQQALTELVEVLISLLDEYRNHNVVSWVTNAKPGHGKTTAMRLVLKCLADQRKQDKVPVIVALRYKPQVEELAAVLNKHKRMCAVPVTSDNLADYIDDLSMFQFVVITQARLKNLALSPGQFHRSYKSWSPLNHKGEPEFTRNRVLIVDEMPDMVDGVIFDLGSTNNMVDWFDKLAKDAGLSDDDRNYARCIIPMLFAKEFFHNKGTTNRPLLTIAADDEAKVLTHALERLPKSSQDVDAQKRFEWFSKLLTGAGVARLYSEREGRRLLAARKVDYTGLGVPLLVMDGTADVTKSFYRGYDLKAVRNYNDYSRLHLYWRKNSTSKRARENETIYNMVAKDIFSLQQEGIRPFPIPAKGDFSKYKEKGVITAEHEARLSDDPDNRNDLVFHLRNLAGSNRLNEESALYFTSLPIANPDAYRLMAFALFGPGVSLELAKSEQQEEGWFEDLAVESLYREWLTAELLQLIHRSALRNLGSNDQISIYMVHNVKWVLERLQFELGLPQENLHEDRLFNPGLAGFEDKVRNFGQLAREYFDKVDIFNAVATVKAIDPTFNKLLEYHRNRPAVTDEANAVLLEDYAVEVGRDERNWKVVRDRRTP